MSAPKKPVQQQKVLPLLDPNNVPEIFTNELTGIHVQDGNCHFTLSVVRPASGLLGLRSYSEIPNNCL